MFFHPVAPAASAAATPTFTLAGSGLQAGVVLVPGRTGLNQLTVVLHDAGHHAVRQATVTALTTSLSMGMGTATADLKEVSPGVFRGTADLSWSGRWGLALLIYQPNGLSRLRTVVRVTP
jgi:hypothetical protein